MSILPTATYYLCASKPSALSRGINLAFFTEDESKAIEEAMAAAREIEPAGYVKFTLYEVATDRLIFFRKAQRMPTEFLDF